MAQDEKKSRTSVTAFPFAPGSGSTDSVKRDRDSTRASQILEKVPAAAPAAVPAPPPPAASAPPPPPPPPLAQAPPPPPSVTGGVSGVPPALPSQRMGGEVGTVPPQPAPVGGVILEETSAADKTRARLMLAMLLVVLLVGGGVTVFSLVSNFRESGNAKRGMIQLVMYQQTVQRMTFMAMAAERYAGFNGAFPTRTEQLLSEGVDAGMQWDKFGTKMKLEGTLLKSAGEDQKHGTEDDFWMDLRTQELGGAVIDVEGELENIGMVPPEMKTALKQARIARERANEMNANMERAIRDAEGYEFQPSLGSTGSSGYESPTFTYNSYEDPNLTGGREYNEDN